MKETRLTKLEAVWPPLTCPACHRCPSGVGLGHDDPRRPEVCPVCGRLIGTLKGVDFDFERLSAAEFAELGTLIEAEGPPPGGPPARPLTAAETQRLDAFITRTLVRRDTGDGPQ